MTGPAMPLIGEVIVYQNFMDEEVRGCVTDNDMYHDGIVQAFAVITATEEARWGLAHQIIRNEGPLR